jgi:glycosylphosphatidylinositol transamidase (GPIT) subunit GPI8
LVFVQHHSDSDLGVAVIDRYTHVILSYLEGINKTSTSTLQDLFHQYSFDKFHSNAGLRNDLFPRDLAQVKLTEFFGGVQDVVMDREMGEPQPQPELRVKVSEISPAEVVYKAKQRKEKTRRPVIQDTSHMEIVF